MCVISTAVIVNETELRELKSKGAWQEQSSALADMHTEKKPQPHCAHAHFPSGQHTDFIQKLSIFFILSNCVKMINSEAP